MLHHLSLGVADLARAGAFYDAVLAPLGYRRLWTDAAAIGYGSSGGSDRLALRAGGAVPGGGPGFHLALSAPGRAAVDAFHAAALRHGGADAGAPGLRPHYGAGYYAAFVADPDGHRIEAVADGAAVLSAIAYVVRDYDEAIAWFTGVLGFELVEDAPREAGKRWVLVQPPGGGTCLLLARAVGDAQTGVVGRQAGGRVFLFLQVGDFMAAYTALGASGVRFVETPRQEDYGWVVVFEDLYGQRWDLLGPAA